MIQSRSSAPRRRSLQTFPSGRDRGTRTQRSLKGEYKVQGQIYYFLTEELSQPVWLIVMFHRDAASVEEHEDDHKPVEPLLLHNATYHKPSHRDFIDLKVHFTNTQPDPLLPDPELFKAFSSADGLLVSIPLRDRQSA